MHRSIEEFIMQTNWRLGLTATAAALALAIGITSCGENDADAPSAPGMEADRGGSHPQQGGGARTLYVWASDVDGSAPDFLAVIDFDPHSSTYGKVLSTLPVPDPGNFGNEPHHCHTSLDGRVLACGGLLSLLKGQNSFFFFDISNARRPKFMFSSGASNSSITDDFVALPGGGFLVTNMGSASGGAGGRVVELDRSLRVVAEYPETSPADGGFNPHGIDLDSRRNLMVTSDFVNPVTTLNAFAGPMEFRSSLRFWNLRQRRIVRTVVLPDAAGTMDVKLIPGDMHGRAVTANMLTGLFYTVDPTDGSFVQSFDCDDIVPHVETTVPGGMPQLLAMPRQGRRLIVGMFMAGQVAMLDITDPAHFKQVSVVSFGTGAGPHSIHLTHDDKRLVVTDYFLDEGIGGKVHLAGDNKVRVLDVSQNALTVSPNFQVVDFNTAFATGPARPHGVGMK
jgi:selenium-binding protein 1